MREGLLWYDGDKGRAPQDKLDQAAARYAERFGRLPNRCHVNPAELFEHASVKVVGDAAVLPHHLWIGQDEELAAAERERRGSRRRKQIA